MIKANTYNLEFNIVIHVVFIKKIKIGRRLKYGIDVRFLIKLLSGLRQNIYWLPMTENH